MIFRNIGQYRYIRPERFNIIQLKTADLRDIPGFRILRHLPRHRNTNIAHQRTIQSPMLTNVMGQRRGGGFPVTTRNAHDASVSPVSICQFNLTDHRNPFALICFTSAFFSGIPGLFITSSPFNILSSLCFPSSYSMSFSSSVCLYCSDIFPPSETNTSYLLGARSCQAAHLPPPLYIICQTFSPAPSIFQLSINLFGSSKHR